MVFNKKYLFLSASIVGLSALMMPQSVMAQTCNSVQYRTTQCVTSAGVAVADSYCTGNGLQKPATYQDCTYSCPPPSPPPSSGDGGGDTTWTRNADGSTTITNYDNGMSGGATGTVTFGGGR